MKKNKEYIPEQEVEENEEDKKYISNYAIDRLVKRRLKEQEDIDKYYKTEKGQEELRQRNKEKIQSLDSDVAKAMKLRDDDSSKMRLELQKKWNDRLNKK